MNMKRLRNRQCAAILIVVIAGFAIVGAASSPPAVPDILTHTGQLRVDGALYTGESLWRFAIVNSTGGILWTNDGSASLPPASGVMRRVAAGRVSISLGTKVLLAEPMQPLPPAVFSAPQTYLRAWVAAPTTAQPEELVASETPVPHAQAFTSVPYSHRAARASQADEADHAAHADVAHSLTPAAAGQPVEVQGDLVVKGRITSVGNSPSPQGGEGGGEGEGKRGRVTFDTVTTRHLIVTDSVSLPGGSVFTSTVTQVQTLVVQTSATFAGPVNATAGVRVGAGTILIGPTTGGAENTITFDASSGTIQTTGTNPLLLNPASGGSVGIGTASPAARLDVHGTVRTNLLIASQPFLETAHLVRLETGVGAWELGLNGGEMSGAFAIGEPRGPERLLIARGTGRVGIGTIAPMAQVDIQQGDDTAGTTALRVRTGTGAAASDKFLVDGAGHTQIRDLTVTGTAQMPGAVLGSTVTQVQTLVVQTSATFTGPARFTDSLEVGEGTIHMAGPVGSTLTNTISFTQLAGQNPPQIRTAATGQQNNAAATGALPLSINTGLTGVLRFNPVSSGGVGVGIGTAVTPAGQLHVQTSGLAAVGTVVQGAAGQTADLQQWQGSAGTVLSRVDSAGAITAPQVTMSTLVVTSSGTVLGDLRVAGRLTAADGVDLSTVTVSSLTATAATIQGALGVGATVTAAGFVGSGSGLTNLNASNLASGTIPDVGLSTNVARRDQANTFAGDQLINSGNLTVNGIDGFGLPSLAVNQVDATTSSTVLRIQTGAGAGATNKLIMDGAGNSVFANDVTVTAPGKFVGNGSGLTTLNAGQLTAGTVPDVRLSTNVARRDQTNVFAGSVTVNGDVLSAGTVTAARFAGDGGGLTNLTTAALGPGSTHYIQNTGTPQVGAMFHVASGTVAGPLAVGGAATVAGNVGIGTGVTPAGRLHVQTSGPVAVGAVVQGLAGQTVDLQQWQDSVGSVLSRVDSAGVLQSVGASPLTVNAGAAGLLNLNPSSSGNVLVGVGGGNIGVGTASPGSRLDVQQTDNTSATTALRVQTGAPATTKFSVDGAGNTIIGGNVTLNGNRVAVQLIGPENGVQTAFGEPVALRAFNGFVFQQTNPNIPRTNLGSWSADGALTVAGNLSVVNDLSVGNNLTTLRDLEVRRNAAVQGNMTVGTSGATSATFAFGPLLELQVPDAAQLGLRGWAMLSASSRVLPPGFTSTREMGLKWLTRNADGSLNGTNMELHTDSSLHLNGPLQSGLGMIDVAEAMDVSEPVEPGEVVAMREDGSLGLVCRREDPGVVGVASSSPGVVLGGSMLVGDDLVSNGKTRIALAGVVEVKVIGPAFPASTLLVGSATAGHAEAAPQNPRAGTIIGKALQPHRGGDGRVRMLVMLR